MTKKRLEYMDMVKGIGILGIIIMHSTTVPPRAVFWISSFAPPLFFLASGMLIGYTKEPEKNSKEMLFGKGRSLLLPFLYFSLLYLLRDFLRVLVGISDIEEVWQGINSLLTLWGNSVLWFLPALFLSESMFIVLRKKFAVPTMVVTCLVMTVVSFFMNELLKPHEVFFLSGRLFYAELCVIRTFLRAVYGLPFICAGYFLFERFKEFWIKERKIFLKRQFLGGAALFASGIPLSVINGYFDFRSLNFGDIPVLVYLSAMISFAGIVLVCKSCPPFLPLIYFGKNSLIVMATHIDFYFLYIALNLANRINEFIPVWNRIFYFINVVGVILVLEIVCIAGVNRYLPFLTGRKKK